jgi:hypothetical protein
MELSIDHILHYTVSVVGFCGEDFGVMELDVMLPAKAMQ